MIKLQTKYTPFKENHEGTRYAINQWLFKFDNGYGASVICHTFEDHICSYGNKEKPFELAVITINEDGYHICHDSTVTDNVIGYLSNREVEEYLEKIEKLESII